jgi:hypothetical protein
MAAWDHNGLGRLKPIGKPDKVHGLPETVWWNTLGELCCTCNRGRLTSDAPCLHKLAMAALSESWMHEAELPTRQALGRGVRVEQLATDERGGYFAVQDNPHGVSRRMVFRSKGGGYYCHGKRDGCPSLTDCEHVTSAKACLIKGDCPVADKLEGLGSGPLARGALSWLQEWDWVLPLIGVPHAVGTSLRTEDLSANGPSQGASKREES